MQQPDTSIAARLPHNAEAERAVLALFLLDAPGIEEAASRLEPTDFFISANRVIFRHIQRLIAEGKSPDTVLLFDSLLAAGGLEEAGGAGYISQIPDGMPRISNLRFYVDTLKHKAQLRRRAHIAEAILQLALGNQGDPVEILRKIEMLSAQLGEGAGHNRILKFRSANEIAMSTSEAVEWIVPGFVVKGGLTELGAKVKTGKTTLIMALVRAVAEGADFLGKPTVKTPTVYLTEQPISSFREAMQRSNLLRRDDVYVLLHADTGGIGWPDIARAAVVECKRLGASLLVVDTLPHFAGLKGDSENNSGDALTAMDPLLRAATEGIGVILVRHERKSGGDVGDSGRGSSAFAGAVDIVISLRKPAGKSKRAQRLIQTVSRFSDTPPALLIELTEGGYVALGEPEEAAFEEAKVSIISLAPESEAEALTVKEIVELCQTPRSTVQRAVEELIEEEELIQVGNGKKSSPYRFFKAENRSCPTSNVNGQNEKSRVAAAGQ